MPKPHECACKWPVCPVCGDAGQGEWYIPDDPVRKELNQLELVINHAINNQTRGRIGKAVGRNRFCRTGYYRNALPGEIKDSKRAYPIEPPDYDKIKGYFNLK